MKSQRSEVKQLLIQIDAEYEAAEQGLRGLAHGTSRHAFLTARTERIAALHTRLGEAVGDKKKALQLIVDHQSLSAKEASPC